jgi:hypothetical protein
VVDWEDRVVGIIIDLCGQRSSCGIVVGLDHLGFDLSERQDCLGIKTRGPEHCVCCVYRNASQSILLTWRCCTEHCCYACIMSYWAEWNGDFCAQAQVSSSQPGDCGTADR